MMLGPNQKGRFLMVGIRFVEDGTWRMITAYWLDRKDALKLYEIGDRHD
jgi:hypothetical protein